jgi:hypothetical protein
MTAQDYGRSETSVYTEARNWLDFAVNLRILASSSKGLGR